MNERACIDCNYAVRHISGNLCIHCRHARHLQKQVHETAIFFFVLGLGAAGFLFATASDLGFITCR